VFVQLRYTCIVLKAFWTVFFAHHTARVFKWLRSLKTQALRVQIPPVA